MGLSLRKKVLSLVIARMSLSVVLVDGDGVTPESMVPFAYEDMDNRTVRETHESGIIRGNTKWLYELGLSDTIVGNTALRNMGGPPWVASNVMAEVAGVVKTNMSVPLEKQGDGVRICMETRYESAKVFGLVDIRVIVAGFVFLGMVHEPIRGTKNPQVILQSGVPSSKKLKALRPDYRVKAAPEKDRVRSMGFSCKGTVAGQDPLAMILPLQRRQEDEEGNAYSRQVGAMAQRYTESTPDWINDATCPILYGNITSKPEYKLYVRTQVEKRYTLNSKGESVSIQGAGWAEPGEAPAHMVLQFTPSRGGAYIGPPGNTF